jgi:hypothetical protein
LKEKFGKIVLDFSPPICYNLIIKERKGDTPMKKYILSCTDNTVIVIETSVTIDSLFIASAFAGKQVYDIILM